VAPRDGFLLLDKPVGLTSFQAVAIARAGLARRWGGARPRVGHAGSLDPLATGLLVLMVGAGTRLSPFLMGLDKTYRLTARFGAGTDTLDALGRVTERRPVDCAPVALAAALARFRGVIDQVPPAYSALKRDGERLYRLAREGRALPELAPRRLRIDRCELLDSRWGVAPAAADAADALAGMAGGAGAGAEEPFCAPDGLLYEARLLVACSSGTYVRALVRDLAAALGTVGHVRVLRRERVGPFLVADALPADAVRDGAAVASALRPLALALPHLPAVVLRAGEARAVRRGGRAEPAWAARLDGAPPVDAKSGEEWFRLTDETGGLVAVAARAAAGGALRLAAVFAAPDAREGNGSGDGS